MEQLKRLPNGYRQRVLDIKARYVRIAKNFQTSKYGFLKNLEWLESIEDSDGNNTYLNIDAYKDKDTGEYHLSFDYSVVNSEIIYNPKTNKYRVLNTCTVFVEGKDGETIGFVDNYKW